MLTNFHFQVQNMCYMYPWLKLIKGSYGKIFGLTGTRKPRRPVKNTKKIELEAARYIKI